MILRGLPFTLIVWLVMLMSASTSTGQVATDASAPGFEAIGVDGQNYSLASFKAAKAVVVCFTCTSCPVARAYEDRLIKFAEECKQQDVAFVAINVNPGEELNGMKLHAEERGFPFVYLYDETGDSARAFGASVTPHLFVLNQERRIVYQGAFDDHWRKPSQDYVRTALNEMLAGKRPRITKTKPIGCQIRLRRR